MRLLLSLIFVSTLLAQTSNYPGSLDTNATLFVTADNVQTVLTSPMLATDNVAIVQSSTGFALNQIATVCDTTNVMGICTAWEHMLVTAVNGNVITVTRAFVGPPAVPHATGKTIAVLIDAAHQSALKNAVIAIETALGANLANIPGSTSGASVSASKGGTGAASPAAHGVAIAEASSPYNYVTPGASGTVLMSNGASADPSYQAVQALPTATAQLQYVRTKPNSGNLSTYEFAAAAPVLRAADYTFSQTPGGTLSVGSNTITLTPCPLGVSGTDVNHQLYFSAGTGTAEVAAITGGTCTGDGVTTGTITVTLGNSHSGAWTVTSATLGQQEAEKVLKAAGKGGTIQLGQGVFSMCGTVTVDTDGITIAGMGSAGTGPIQTGGTGAAGTQIKPCSANQVLYNVPGGYGYGGAGTNGSTVAKLSMHDVGFSNNGLSGITAIKLLRDAGGMFSNLNFAGTSSAFYGFYADRVWGTEISNITSSGTAGSFFGSSVDGISEWTYSTVKINQWIHDGPGVLIPVMTWQRCVNCSLHSASFVDENGSATGTGMVISNDSQGNVVSDLLVESYLTGLELISSTVGATTAAPGWNTLTDYQYDFAGGSPAIIGLLLGAGSFETSVINPTLTAPTTTGVAISANGPPPSGHNVARIANGYFGFTQPVAQLAVNTGVSGLTVVGNTFITSSPGAAIYPTGSASNLLITGNQMLGSSANAIVPGATITTSYIAHNYCSNDTTYGTCSGYYGPAWNRDSQGVAYATLPTCVAGLAGSHAVVNDSNTVTWGANIAGGGANTVQAFCDASHWTVSGK